MRERVPRAIAHLEARVEERRDERVHDPPIGDRAQDERRAAADRELGVRIEERERERLDGGAPREAQRGDRVARDRIPAQERDHAREERLRERALREGAANDRGVSRVDGAGASGLSDSGAGASALGASPAGPRVRVLESWPLGRVPCPPGG